VEPGSLPAATGGLSRRPARARSARDDPGEERGLGRQRRARLHHAQPHQVRPAPAQAPAQPAAVTGLLAVGLGSLPRAAGLPARAAVRPGCVSRPGARCGACCPLQQTAATHGTARLRAARQRALTGCAHRAHAWPQVLPAQRRLGHHPHAGLAGVHHARVRQHHLLPRPRRQEPPDPGAPPARRAWRSHAGP